MQYFTQNTIFKNKIIHNYINPRINFKTKVAISSIATLCKIYDPTFFSNKYSILFPLKTNISP